MTTHVGPHEHSAWVLLVLLMEQPGLLPHMGWDLQLLPLLVVVPAATGH
jgi:hypothetical protein